MTSEEYFLVITSGADRLVVGARGRRIACSTGPLDNVLSDRPRSRALEGWHSMRGALAAMCKYAQVGQGVEVTPYARHRGDWSVEVYLRTGDQLKPYSADSRAAGVAPRAHDQNGNEKGRYDAVLLPSRHHAACRRSQSVPPRRGARMRSNVRLVHGQTRVTHPLVNAFGTVVDSTKHTILVRWDNSNLEPRWHDKSGLEMVKDQKKSGAQLDREIAEALASDPDPDDTDYTDRRGGALPLERLEPEFAPDRTRSHHAKRTIVVWQGQGDKRKRVAGGFTRDAALRKAKALSYASSRLVRRGDQLGYDAAGGFIYIIDKKTGSHATKKRKSPADASNYARLARDVPATRAYKPSKWSKSDRDALSKVLTYAERFAANQGLRPVHPHLVPSGDSNFGQVYNSLGLRTNERTVAVFSSYDNARAAVVIAEQAARASGTEVP